MKITSIHSFFVLLLCVGPAVHSLQAQAVITVPGNYPTIQAAITAAPNGATINVSPGTYRESKIDLKGKRIILQSTNGPSSTIIDGSSRFTIFEAKRGETLSTQIIGFTIQNGNGVNNVVDPWNNVAGQLPGAIAIYAYRAAGSTTPIPTSLTVKNCVFRNNQTVRLEARPGEALPPLRPTASRVKGFGGGAIRITGGGMLSLSGNIFVNNQASSNGGAVEVALSSAKIVGNTFSGNKAGFHGGAIKVTPKVDGSLQIDSNTFTSNIARGLGNPINSGCGGGVQISCGGQAPEKNGIDFYSLINKNSFIGNIARFSGGGISIFGANAKITSNTFKSNNPDYPSNPDRWYDPVDGTNYKTGVFGGAVHLESQGVGTGGDCKFEVVSNVISGNKVRHQGGGILVYLQNNISSVLISRNQIIGNVAEYPGKTYSSASVSDPYGAQKMGQGGGILVSAPYKDPSTGVTTPNASVITVSSNLIQKNSAQDFAAGQFSGGRVAFQSNTVDANLGIYRHGGMVFQMSGDLDVTGNAIKNNKVVDAYQTGTGDRSGGIFVTDLRDLSANMVSNTFSNNRGRLAGAVYLAGSLGRLNLTSNKFISNITTGRDDKARPITGSFTADGASKIPAGMGFVATSNTFFGDVISLAFLNYSSAKISVQTNAFSGATSIARGKLDGLVTVDYPTVSSLNATLFAEGNTGTP